MYIIGMSVTFKGAKTLGELIPDLQKSLDSAQVYLLGQDKDAELKDGLMGDLNNQITAFEHRIAAASLKLQEVQAMINQAEEINQGLAEVVDNIGNDLASAGIYTFTITNEASGLLSSDLSQAMLQAGIPSGSLVGGVVLIATDGASVAAINNVIKLV